MNCQIKSKLSILPKFMNKFYKGILYFTYFIFLLIVSILSIEGEIEREREREREGREIWERGKCERNLKLKACFFGFFF